MSWLKKRTKLCVGTFTVLLIIFWFLHFVMILHDHEIAMESLIWEDKYEEAINSIHTDELRTSTIILLQQSQVQTEKQLERLRSIDTGWARWKNATNACNDIRIVAALPNDVPPKDDFKLIGSLPMLPAAWAKIGSNKTSVSSPYHHLVCSLLALLSSSQSSQRYPSLKWIVLANDHTFLIPQNLAKHLNAMDSDGLLYTGNQLALPFHKKILSFASGGAGAVLSHATAKLILSAWLLITDEDILLSMLDGYASANSAHHENTPKVHWPQHSRDGDEKSMCTTLLNYLTCHPVHGSSVAACEVIIDMTPTAHADMGCYLYALRQWLDRTSILPFINERLTNIMQVIYLMSYLKLPCDVTIERCL